MLQITEASVRYGDLLAVDRVSLDLPTGQVLAVLGPSGCGKSTLLRAVAGLEPLTAGSISFDGGDLAGVPTHRRGFALMFQDGQLFEHQSVGSNVGYPLRLRRRSRGDIGARVAELLELVGLGGYADRSPGTLSGGERQRVALARALAVEPRLLLLDEPLSALDKSLRERLAVDLRAILTAAGTTALLVTHDHEEAFAIADRMAVLHQGRLVQSGTVSDVWQHPADAETARFLGYAAVLTDAAAHTVTVAAGLAPAEAVALRRSALEVADRGPLAGTVLTATLSPEQMRLTVAVDELGVLDAVAASGTSAPLPGQRVRLRLDVTRIAVVGPGTNPLDSA
ncbi:ABC transporter ATP-binding protein [Nocardioides sp.]|uniref:ABC transporter ATP-binding protein n=1 Tax=Nocardioides sp. TaxID=35761 RepID=UPI003D12BCAB